MPRAKHVALTRLFASVLIAALAMSGCADKGPTFVESGTSYTKATALELLAESDTSRFAQHPTSEADALRHTALTALRRHGASASATADLITRTFPQAAHGVPVYVERGSFEGVPATILVEATGPASGKLGTKRLWAIGGDGRVLFVATR